MSIAIVLIPLALPAVPILIGLRLILGKEGFQKLINSMQMKIPTSVRDKTELTSVITSAGYDVQPWLGGLKTHLAGKSQFLTWEFDGQKWAAVFAKGVPEGLVAEFIRNVEAKAGRAIFSSNTSEATGDAAVLSEPFPTNFRDEFLLIKTLTDAGASPTRDPAGDVVCSVGRCVLRLIHVTGEPYQVEVQNTIDRQELLQHLMALDEDYRRCVQADTYQNLKMKIAEKNLTIESEEVLEDNSIVLTLEIQERA
jgi:hypothetical protein